METECFLVINLALISVICNNSFCYVDCEEDTLKLQVAIIIFSTKSHNNAHDDQVNYFNSIKLHAITLKLI